MSTTMTARSVALLLAVLLGAMTLAWIAADGAQPAQAGAAVTKGDKDCADFKTQKKAQKFFKKNNPSADPHYLDADNDGIACEDNPCPCASKIDFSRESVVANRRF